MSVEGFVSCPGCGGRNPVGSTECDWCGRPFISTTRRLRITAWQLLSTLLLLVVIGAVGLLAFLNAGRNLPVRVPSATSTSLPTTQPTPAVTPRVLVAPVPTATAQPTPTSTLNGAEPPTPEPTPTPERQFALIANTGGAGVSVRREPGPQAPRAGVLREGTRVQLTGNDSTVAARAWREIETEDHALKGWVRADFLQLR
jgi:hypothetical protein